MCPQCHSKKVRRSYPKMWEFVFLIFLGRPMRCRTCDFRFYNWPWSLSSLPARPVAEPPKLTAFKPPRRRSAAAAAGKG
jgi:hypothetical protein